MSLKKIGLINGLLTLITWSVIGMSLASYWWGALPIILFILVPVSALVSYRTSALAQILLQGKATVSLYAIDGFKWAFIASCIFWGWSISSEVLAAGGPLLGANGWQVLEYIFTIAIPSSLVAGLIGSLHGVVFYYLNRWQITANNQLKRDF